MGKKRTALPEWFERGISAAYLFILALVMALQNSDSIWGNGETWGDASVYKYVAWMMDLGYMPYKDTFDHKGPLLYCFFLAGRQIASWRGVWVLYFGVLFLSLCLIYLIFRRFCTRPVSCALMLVIFALSFDYAVDNMSPEDLSLPFLACALIIFLDYFLYDKISRWRLLLTGACFGAVLMMKAQMISVWFVFCIAVLIRNLREKTPGKIGYFLSFFLAGCAAVVLPFCIWLVRGGAWKDFIEDYIVFNMKYSRSYSGSTALESLLNKARAAVYYLNRPIVLIGLFLCAALVLLDRSNRSFHAVYLVYLLVTIALASLAGKTYRHYGAGLIVALSYPLAAFASFAGGAARVPAGDPLEETAGDPPRKSAEKAPQESAEEAPQESAGNPLRKSAGEVPQESTGNPPRKSAGEALQESTGSPLRKSAGEAPQESTAGPVRKSVTGTAAGKGDGKGSGGRPQWLPGVCFLGLAWMVCVYAAPVFFTKVDYALESFHKNITGETALSSELQGILDVIAANTDPEDRITVHALKDIIYGKSERLSASRYSFQHAFGTVDPAKNDEYFAELEADPPKLIVQGDTDPERMMEFITSHGYHWIATSESGEFRIYKRGDGDSASVPEWADSLCRTVSFTEYLDRLSGLEEERDLFVFFAVKGRPGKELSVKNADQLRELGFHDTDLLLDDDYHSFLGVSKGKECLYQSLGGSGADFYEGRIEGLEVSLASATKKRGNQASIAVGGVEYALDQRGFNIVVYDAETSTVIDSVAFDTHSGDTDCTR